jgi:AcrR family transcriptional regulator
MVEKRRKPGRPAYGSREKLIAATCALLAERDFEAISPTMILKRSGVGHGSMYHYFDGKEDLAVAAMDHLRTRTFAILRTASEEAASDDDAAEDSDSTPADMDAALDLLFARQAGQALLRLLADPTVAGSVALSKSGAETPSSTPSNNSSSTPATPSSHDATSSPKSKQPAIPSHAKPSTAASAA